MTCNVYELYFKLKTNLFGAVVPYLQDIESLETDEEKLVVIKGVVEKIKNEGKVFV
ncbi:hypothetical protein C5S31_05325 [ANME-1 cluster archaeon GoMg2]|nr:hypothetical protein [ANME-1 cluster archaeon GoMg2]